MAIYFKFKSAKTFDSVCVDGPSISVASFKRKIYQLKYKGKQNSGLCYGNDFDIIVINAQTNHHYANENTLIPIQTSVLIQRVPGNRRNKPIDTSAIVIPGCLIPKSSSSTTITTTSSCDAVSTSNESSTSKTLCFANSFPAELMCPLCKQPMKDATFTSKCCLSSFCDKCIRDHLIHSDLSCVCGATNMLTDYLIPNVTVRGLISSILRYGFTIPQNSQTSKEGSLGTKKRKKQSYGNVATESYVMRTGIYPSKSFGNHFNGHMQQPSFSVL